MTLSYNFAGMINRIGKEKFNEITNHPTEKGHWHPVTDALIWVTMGIGIGDITEKNVNEFADRVLTLQAATGGLIATTKESIVVTREDVEAHIGMTTNVFPKWTKTKFYAHIARVAKDEGERMSLRQDGSGYEIVNAKIKAST